MKQIRTTLAHQELTFGEGDARVVVGRKPITLEDQAADAVAARAGELGMSVVVEDAPEGAVPADFAAALSSVADAEVAKVAETPAPVEPTDPPTVPPAGARTGQGPVGVTGSSTTDKTGDAGKKDVI